MYKIAKGSSETRSRHSRKLHGLLPFPAFFSVVGCGDELERDLGLSVSDDWENYDQTNSGKRSNSNTGENAQTDMEFSNSDDKSLGRDNIDQTGQLQDVAQTDVAKEHIDGKFDVWDGLNDFSEEIYDDALNGNTGSTDENTVFSLAVFDEVLSPENFWGTYEQPQTLELPEIDGRYSEDYRSHSKSIATFRQLSSNPELDALVVGNTLFSDKTGYIWSGSSEPLVISFSFVDPALRLLDQQDYGDPGADPLVNRVYNSPILEFSETQKLGIRKAVSIYEQIINVKFVEVIEVPNEVGTLRIGLSAESFGDTVAFALQPGNYWASNGDIWFDRNAVSGNFSEGEGFYFFAVLHELGHALGLKHPHEASFTNDTVLEPIYDFTNYTIMSYNDPEWVETDNGVWTIANGPQLLDIQALQFLYGPNDGHNLDNNRYIFGPDIPYSGTVWDAGGQDIFDFSNLSIGARIDMNSGSYSTLAIPGWSPLNNVGIAHGVSIEDVIGTTAGDIIIGNEVNNILLGNSGDDILYGGAGNDIFDFDFRYSGGYDQLIGGTGDDVYFLSVGDVVVEEVGEGYDTVILLDMVDFIVPQGIERVMSLSNNDVSIFGNEDDNVIRGGSGNDILIGASGADAFLIYEGMGHDIVMDFSSSNGDHIGITDPDLAYEYTVLDTGFLITVNANSSLQVLMDEQAIV